MRTGVYIYMVVIHSVVSSYKGGGHLGLAMRTKERDQGHHYSPGPGGTKTEGWQPATLRGLQRKKPLQSKRMMRIGKEVRIPTIPKTLTPGCIVEKLLENSYGKRNQRGAI